MLFPSDTDLSLTKSLIYKPMYFFDSVNSEIYLLFVCKS